ncbi:hypothetical protein PBY51_017423 [Eleginops maclovinus]|uniref:Ig-like domain-containing protein n=1 Tax=Eleginops maclovinus TaxID=56733 RepID=A0AAN8AMS0_ELEMC|nr:hypothetical protein PBY51_017423 [Eleginops maclovinus]
MTLLGEFAKLFAVFLAIFSFSFQGASCQLVVTPADPSLVNALAGSNVTLAVSFSGADDPTVTWLMGDLPVVTWIIATGLPPDIPENRRKVLNIEKNGSLTFVNVTLEYTSNYTIELTKSGLGKSRTTFTLEVFERIQNVILSAQPDVAIEGAERFTLQYSMLQGVVQQQMWFFNDIEIKSNSRYTVEERSLVILGPNRLDSGSYTVLLTNPFSSVTTRINVTVLYGPEKPVLEALPAQPFYLSGDTLNVSCRAEGVPLPTAKWLFGTQIPDQFKGVLNLTNVQSNQAGNYTCTLVNEQTKEELQRSIILKVYERPSGIPMCSVQAVNNVSLQYSCMWSGGTPKAVLSFPTLSDTSSRVENFSLIFNASDNLNGKNVACMADHPVEQNQCSITANNPMMFRPTVRTKVSSDGKIVVTIECVSKASPEAVVSWSQGNETSPAGTTYQISINATQLQIRDYNVSNFIFQNYTCTCSNPLGSQRRAVQLQGPSISDFSLFRNHNGTIITLTWEVPPTSVVTGFDIQLKGPDLPDKHRNSTQNRGSANTFHTIHQEPGSIRSVDFFLDPSLTYRFRVIPKALMTEGEPSEVQRTGPGEGLSGPAIAGIAAGIPCSLLFLVLLGCAIYFCFYWKKNKRRQTRYPVSRAVEKAITTHKEVTPHNLLTGGLKSPPDYNKLNLNPSERSMALPTFVPPAPVRVATTV